MTCSAPLRRAPRQPTRPCTLGDAVSELGRAVLKTVVVEPAEHRAILANEHGEDAGASLLLGQQGVVLLGEMSKNVSPRSEPKVAKLARFASSKAKTAGA